MSLRIFNQKLLDDPSFWKGKQVLLPRYNRAALPIKSPSFSAGRMIWVVSPLERPSPGLPAPVPGRSPRPAADRRFPTSYWVAVLERPPLVRQILTHLGLPTTGPAFARRPPRPMTWPLTSRASGPTNRSSTCLCVARRQATSPSPIRCSQSRGRGARLPRLAASPLRIRMIRPDPPLRWWRRRRHGRVPHAVVPVFWGPAQRQPGRACFQPPIGQIV